MTTQGREREPRDTPVLLALLDDPPQIAAFAVLHDNVQLGAGLVNDAVIVAHNERVAQLAQDVHL